VPIRVDGTVGAANSCGWTGPAPFKERRRMAMWRKEKLTHWPIDANQISEPRVTFRPAPMLLAHPTPLRRHTPSRSASRLHLASRPRSLVAEDEHTSNKT
jgi:hypothetical protein